jgi:hypothetical protein
MRMLDCCRDPAVQALQIDMAGLVPAMCISRYNSAMRAAMAVAAGSPARRPGMTLWMHGG